MQTLKAFLSDESGAAAIEYSLIAGWYCPGNNRDR
jgi:Flp pilus assembly pilin Flp